MTVECQECTESVNSNYTLHTGRVTVCLDSDGVIRDLGNVVSIAFGFVPEFVEHFRGSDGGLDAKIPLRKNYTLNMVVDELTPANFAIFVGESMSVNLPSGCKIPLRGATGQCTGSTGAFQFEHQFACGDKTLTINIWRALLSATEGTLEFGEDILSIPISVEALPCDSTHPDEPYGNVIFSQECESS